MRASFVKCDLRRTQLAGAVVEAVHGSGTHFSGPNLS